jgi:hypothetical protein
MKKMIASIAFLFFTAVSAMADYTIYLPTKPGSGLDQWAQVVIKELKKHIDGEVKSVHIPGARHLLGMNKWQNENRFNEGAITVTGGTTSVNTLVVKGVEYDYTTWDAIGVQLLDIFVGKRKDWNPKDGGMVFGNDHAAGDVTGMVLMYCGNLDGKIESYKKCVDEDMKYVKGVDDKQGTLMFANGEFNVFRGNPTAWTKQIAKFEHGELWFTQGVYDKKKKRIVTNPNAPGKDFDTVFKETWGEEPKGELYDAYRLVQFQNDSLQKGLWVNKDAKHRKELVKALKKMLKDPESRAIIAKASGGDYEWAIGEEADKIVQYQRSLYTEEKLKNIVWWFNNIFGWKAEFKPELLK